MDKLHSPTRVLVVDDNHDAADMIVAFLEICGCEAIPRYDGQSAVETAKAFKPDVVFCDLGMPQMDGYQVAAKLRSMDCLRQTRLVALTAWNDAACKAKVIQAGFHCHLAKPAELDSILAQLPRES